MNRIGILELARQKVVVLDGATGTALQEFELGLDDFQGLEGCNDVLVHSRPDVVLDVHAAYLKAGCDVIETNTFGANRVVLAEYGIADRTFELNLAGARLARQAAADFSTPDQPRYVLGSVGPGTRLPSLGHIDFDSLSAAFMPQMRGLIQGGADAICIETCQDLLQIRAALHAARAAFRIENKKLPLFVSITIESSGTMLVGSDVHAAVAALWPLGIDVLGLNCATGPAEMKRHVQDLARLGPERLMAMPNAGLPQNIDGKVVYDLGPDDFVDWVEGFVRDDGIGFVGGCCGTTESHIVRLAKRMSGLPAPVREVSRRAEISSLFQAVSCTQEPPPMMLGERTNANGSKAFRKRLLADDLEGMLAVAREQERGGAHALDVSVAYVGRNEVQDMTRFVESLSRTNRLPITIDSTDPAVIEAALKLCGGRCTINSINLEDGWPRLDQIAGLARSFGAAVIALVIDETEMAMTTARKLEVAERIYERCTVDHGLAPQDLVFDMLTFTVASGDATTRNAAVETLDAIERFKQRHPEVLTVLGVSNVSFGLRPAARRVLNSVFLHLAVERGLDQAIVNARGITPLYRIDEQLKEAATRLLLNDQSIGDPLAAYMALFEGVKDMKASRTDDTAKLPPREAIHRMVVDGISKGLHGLLDGLVNEGMPPVEIINTVLIDAMKEVGELFGSGGMQLPFVLQSAEVMKSAVAHLEGCMDGVSSQDRGTLVLATVKGDVHDIGKNLVDIIVSNNGFKVVNLGTKMQIEEMLAAVDEHNADAIGMSGLLVKSTVVMKDNLEEMKRRGRTVPVLLGGAALTRGYVEQDLRLVYGNNVFYCKDAFDGLNAMVALEGEGSGVEITPDPDPDPLTRPRAESARKLSLDAPTVRTTARTPELGDSHAKPVDHALAVPEPPFTGSRILDNIPLEEVFALLNETTLFRGQWKYRRGKLSREEYEALTRDTIRPLLGELKSQCQEEGLLVPRATYGYYRCFSRGHELVVLSDDGQPLTSLHFPRQRSAPYRCIADFFRPEGHGTQDLVGLFVVTVGGEAGAAAARAYQENRYKDYLHLHGLAVESAEATAEWLHGRMRRELGFGQDDGDGDGERAMGTRGYRGSRYSFGYPACPNLDDQKVLFELLRPERIQVSLTEGMQMVPEYSVSALMTHHPEAKYFDLD